MLSPKHFFRGSALALVGLIIIALLVIQYSEENNDQDRGRSYTEDHQEEESGVFLGIIVASFGIAITLGLVLLPLLICCSSVTRHPLYLR